MGKEQNVMYLFKERDKDLGWGIGQLRKNLVTSWRSLGLMDVTCKVKVRNYLKVPHLINEFTGGGGGSTTIFCCLLDIELSVLKEETTCNWVLVVLYIYIYICSV